MTMTMTIETVPTFLSLGGMAGLKSTKVWTGPKLTVGNRYGWQQILP